METLRLRANAKINLFLDISSRRNDGYHNIVSLMQSVSLADVINVSYEAQDYKKIEITVNNPEIPANEKNIAYKAADRLIDRGYVKIDIEKNIPSPAGLAGGSADAAAVIYALGKFGCVEKTENEIAQIAAKIGADVPFCLVGGTKKISGIGDVIEYIPTISKLYLVIAVDGEGVSTPDAYAMLDKKYNNFLEYKVREFDFENFSVNDIYNVFEDVILPLRDKALNLKEKMYSFGASVVLMSGSGPAIVGIFDSYDKAVFVADSLNKSGVVAYACTTTDKGIEEI